jgi:polyferredoxin
VKPARISQWLRKLIQLSVVSFIAYAALLGAWRNYKVAHNHSRIVGLIHGDFWGSLYAFNEELLELFGKSFSVSLGFLSFPWSARVGGLDATDPLLALTHSLETRSLHLGLILSALVPVLIAVVFGKVFCSHLCPMRLLFELGQAARRGLIKLELPLPAFRSPERFGGFVLLGGLGASLLSGMAAWYLLLPYVALGAGLFVLISAGVMSLLWFVVLFWLLVDMLLAPGFFCHNVCPTGFLLEQLGRFSSFKLSRVDKEPCPGGCERCKTVCPYGLFPAQETHRPACDACGLCVPACPKQKLARRLPIVMGLCFGLLSPAAASAHHNKGLPHYGYFENYPQVPTEEYVTIQGDWEIGATVFNFQGLDRRAADTPNDVKIYLYLYNLKEDRNYTGELDVELRRNGEVVSRFERLGVDLEAIYATRETLPESGRYELVAHAAGQALVLPFYVDLASDSVPYTLIALLATPIAGLFVLALVGRKRRRRKVTRTAVALTTFAILASFAGPVAPVHAQPVASAELASIEIPTRGVKCPDCGMLNCTMAHYETEDGGSVMVMGGIPLWLFLTGIGGLIAFTFVGVEVVGASKARGFRLNLIKNRKVYRFVRSRWFQSLPQLLSLIAFGGLVWAGLVGSRVRNVAPIAVWTVWWAGLIFAVLLFASAWCFVCPWDGLANLVSRLRLSKKSEPLCLDLPFPHWAKNVYPAIALFTLLTWLELGYGVTTDPRSTAYMGLGMAGLAVSFALLFRGKKFCEHVCPVGRICGIYSNVSPVEIRAHKASVCAKCRTEDCLHGNERGYPCPTGISLKTVEDATFCTNCTECIKSCNKQNVAVNLRPFGADLRSPTRVPRLDEAWLAVALLSLTLFHGLSMTPTWESFEPGAFSILKWTSVTLGVSRVVAFTLAMAVATAIPVLLYVLACHLSARWAQNGVTTQTLFRSYAYSLLPVALFYHLAHNLMHLLMEGGEVVPLLSDPLGHGTDYLGTASMHVGSLIGEELLWYLQVGLILIGHVFGIIVAHRIGHKLYRKRADALKSLVTMPVMMVLISVCGLWLMHMDMNMRIGRM